MAPQALLKISIVTPNFNGADYLRSAIGSVVSQDYEALQYVVVDGASQDGSALIAHEFRNQLSALVIEPDKGHADALNKGFALTDGEIMGWINSDDMLHPGCLSLVSEIFQAYPEIEWITGRPSSMDGNGQVEHVGEVRPWSQLRFLSGDHLWIQQESTFWRRSLWERAGGQLDTDFELANDFELWARFFRHAPLYSVDFMLGCFRVRPGQRSVDQRAAYDREALQILQRELDQLDVSWRETGSSTLPAVPRTLTPAQKAQIEPQLRAYDPPIIRVGDVRSGKALPLGGPQFSTQVTRPEPVSDITAFKDRHRNERCFIMGNGPSLNKTNLDLLKGETVFACNAAFLLFNRLDWRPSYYTCVDSRVLADRAEDITAMLEKHPEINAFFPAQITDHGAARTKVATRSLIAPGEGRYYFNEVVGSLDDLPWSQFSPDAQARIVQPHTVAITMLQLAAYMGFSEIYLIGCDARYVVPDDIERENADDLSDPRIASTSADPNHFDASYFGPGRKWHMPNTALMKEHFGIAKTALEAMGVSIKNATVGGDLETFDRIALEDLFTDASASPEQRRPATPQAQSAANPPSLLQLRLAKLKQLAANNASWLFAVGCIAFCTALAFWLLPEGKVWAGLVGVTALLGSAVVAVALKTRRITQNLALQLRLVQNQHARAELALQKSEHEVFKLRRTLQDANKSDNR